MKFKIVADSSADLKSIEKIPFSSAPLKIMTDEREYVDNNSIDTNEMMSYLSTYKGRSRTSCPTTLEFLEAFGEAENVFCVTITSNLSGSYNAARVAANEYEALYPERHVHVIDTLSVGPESMLIIEKLIELIEAGKEFAEIKEEITEYQKKTGLFFMLESLHNLANNGRVSPLVAKIATIIGMRIVGKASAEGTLEITNKSRGVAGGISDLMKNLRAEGFGGGRIRIRHADNLATAEKIKEKILLEWPEAEIVIGECGGLCSFYAERGGILVGFERA